MNRRPVVRMLLASAATTVAISLAGCDTETLSRSDLRAKQPLSPRIVAEIENKNMSKGSPLLVRIFKEEAELEVWKQKRDGRFALLKTYPICRWSGELGPKKKEGDRQAPEGFYTITPGQMNPLSSYYLAFNMGYPNAFDRAHRRTGSQLMVHGDCSSRGCYAMTDEQIGEIYALAREAFFGGQRAFQVQAFPFRMTPVNMARHRANPNIRFWQMLKRGYDHFEVTRLEPKVDVCEKHYVFDAQAPDGTSFNPNGACPAYEVPADILAAVREKQERDRVRTAKLVGFTRVAPIKTGTDGGMNSVYLAALRETHSKSSGATTVHALAATPHGTIPPTVNPPRTPKPVYASRETVVESTKVVLASAESRPADPPASGTGFFGFVSRAIGSTATSEEQPRPLAGRPQPFQTASHPAPQPAPSVVRQVAAAPPPRQVATMPARRPTPTAVATTASAKPALRGTNASAERPITTTSTRSSARARAAAPQATASFSSPSTMTSMAGPVIRGAQPALHTGSFENRWSALR